MAGLSSEPKVEYSVFDLSGGVNLQNANALLQEKQASAILNMRLDDVGKIKKREGIVANRFYTLPEKINQGVQSLFSYVKINGNRQDVLFYEDKTMYATVPQTGNWQQVAFFEAIETKPAVPDDPKTPEINEETPAEYDYQPYTPKGTCFSFFTFWMADEETGIGDFRLYCTNEYDGVFKLYEIYDEEHDTYTLAAKQIPSLPKAAFAVVHKDRVFYGGIQDHPDAFLFSYVYNCEEIGTYVFGDAIEEVSESGGGGMIRVPSSPDVAITALATFKGSLIIFKSDSIHILSGDNPSNYVLERLNVASGCLAANTVLLGNNALYYLSDDGIRYITTTGQEVIETFSLSHAVNKHLMTYDPKKVVSTYFKNRLYFFCQGDHPSTLVFFEATGSWSIYDVEANCAFNDKELDYLLFGSKTGYVYHLENEQLKDELTFDTYTPIRAMYATPFYSFNEQQITKRFNSIMLFFKPNAVENSTVQLKIEIDYKDTYKEANAEYLQMKWGEGKWGRAHWGSMRDQISQIIQFGGTGKTIRFTFSNQAIDEDLEIHGFVVSYKRRKRRR